MWWNGWWVTLAGSLKDVTQRNTRPKCWNLVSSAIVSINSHFLNNVIMCLEMWSRRSQDFKLEMTITNLYQSQRFLDHCHHHQSTHHLAGQIHILPVQLIRHPSTLQCHTWVQGMRAMPTAIHKNQAYIVDLVSVDQLSTKRAKYFV